MKHLIVSAFALLALTAPAFACVYCEKVTGYAGSPGDTRSGTVFYGDVNCGAAGTCVMPSLSAPGSSSAVETENCPTPTMRASRS
jgi:hypothetical protein